MARGRFARPAKTIDFKQWDALPALTFSGPASTGNTGGSQLAFSSPATILRMRGRFIVGFDETMVLGDKARVGFGIGVISTDSATLGATALPDPLGDPEFPWLWWYEVNMITAASGDVSSRAFGMANQVVEFDSKAMRKIKPSQSLVLVFETGDTVGNPTIEMSMAQTRVLFGT